MSEKPEIGFAEVLKALSHVNDPEMGLSLVELGLIYGHKFDADTGNLVVEMTLTSKFCPMAPQIIASVKSAALMLPLVENVHVELVWTPPWNPREHASDDAKATLGIWD